MGTTFGGGPMACAIAEAVIDAIESEKLLAQRAQGVDVPARSSCLVGPVTGIQGAGFLLGLRTTRPAKEVQAALLESEHPGRHQRRSARTAAAAGLHPERRARRPARAMRCAQVARMRRFLDTGRFPARPGARSARAGAVAAGPSRAARARRQDPGTAVLQSQSLRTLASFQAGMARLGGSSFVITPGQGTWQLETRMTRS